MMNKLSFTVVIPAYNAATTIQYCLEQLLKQTYSPLSIIVIDDGSTDTTADLVQAIKGVTYVYQANAGPASARNAGARLAQSDIVCFIDSDCLARPDWLEKIAQGFEVSQAAVVAGSYGIANIPSRLARNIYREIAYRHKKLMPDYPQSFGSYNVAIRKDVFEAVGGFDTSYRHASGEDNDLSYRILNQGEKIYFAKNALVDHYHPEQWTKYLKEQFRHGYWRVKMYVDHPDRMQGDDYTFWKDIIEVPLAGCLLVLGLGGMFAPYLWSKAGTLCIAIFLLEMLFAASFLKAERETERDAFDVPYMGGVMLLRSIARLCGFMAGAWDNLRSKKKVN